MNKHRLACSFASRIFVKGNYPKLMGTKPCPICAFLSNKSPTSRMVTLILFGPQENIFHKRYCKNIVQYVLFGSAVLQKCQFYKVVLQLTRFKPLLGYRVSHIVPTQTMLVLHGENRKQMYFNS